MKLKLLAALLLGAAALPAAATTLVIDSGWQDDTIEVANVPSVNSPWEFTLSGNAFFRVTDAFIVGDIFTITDAANSISTQTSFTTDGATVEEFAGVNWDDTSYSRISLLLGAGTYAITIAGDCAGGCSAGLGVRLDTATAAVIPEPASWAMMVAGFGLVGSAFRSRRRTTVTA